jgi:hypothetical protein
MGPRMAAGSSPPRTATLDGRRGPGWTAAEVRRTSALAVRCLGWRTARVGGGPNWSSAASGVDGLGQVADGLRVILLDVLGGKDVVEGRDGRTDGRFCLLGIGRNG